MNHSKLVRRGKHHVELMIYQNGNSYPIDYDRMNTPEKVLGWIYHLCGKTSVTKEHLRAFVAVAKDIGVRVDHSS